MSENNWKDSSSTPFNPMVDSVDSGIQKNAGKPSDSDIKLTDQDFQKISEFVYKICGIVLRPEKKVMVYSRLLRRLKALGFSSFSEYVQLLYSPSSKSEITYLLNAITTNLTRFFREEHHFKFLQDHILKSFLENARTNNEKKFRIWSAGCSSGEEPYSIAMSALDIAPAINAQIDFKILATDIDTNMIQTGRYGLYKNSQGIPKHLGNKFCDQLTPDNIQIKDIVKRLITFNKLNLLEEWPMKGPFDVIFCRNVVIYFDKATQKKLFDRYAEILKPNGWLFIGHSESLYNLTDRFTLIGQTIYQKVR